MVQTGRAVPLPKRDEDGSECGNTISHRNNLGTFYGIHSTGNNLDGAIDMVGNLACLGRMTFGWRENENKRTYTITDPLVVA